MKLIVGLGNPGSEYAKTRHNFGFMVVDLLAETLKSSFKDSKYKAEIASAEINGEKVLLVKPQTFMNVSGEAVQPLAHFYKVAPQDILVVFDDLDLPFGRMRLAAKGGAAGHNGIKSLISHLGTQEFPRLKMGIGRPPGVMEVTDFVLSAFVKTQKKVLEELLIVGVNACTAFVKEGLTTAMNAFNGTQIDE
ncbi:aminoacyl-tRNA hydrolase [bacterium]|nr:aminoacyl-tRNA hydrolase [bacterium]